MNLKDSKVIHPSAISEKIAVVIPGSKSHTIRALLLAALAKGKSTIHGALVSGDTESCLNVLSAWGMRVQRILQEDNNVTLIIENDGMLCTPFVPQVDVGNSGTTLYFATALASLHAKPLSFDGDESLRTRSAKPLLDALVSLGATVVGGDNGCVPYTIAGSIHNGEVHIQCSTSQYVSALMFALSLVDGKSIIYPQLAGEFPYIDMTMFWLRQHGIEIKNEYYKKIEITGGNIIHPFTTHIPGDFSSATFLFCASAISGYSLHIKGLLPHDTQADSEVLKILETMGCSSTWTQIKDAEWDLRMNPSQTIRGGIFDLSNIPDALPALAVTACYADTPTTLYNVEHARKKETDRIAVMAKELRKLQIRIEEHVDGLTIYPSVPQGGILDSHGDHRIAMAFAILALSAQGAITVEHADSASVTFPSFYDILVTLGVTVT